MKNCTHIYQLILLENKVFKNRRKATVIQADLALETLYLTEEKKIGFKTKFHYVDQASLYLTGI